MRLQTRSSLFFIPLFAVNIVVVIFFISGITQSSLEKNTTNESKFLSNEIEILEEQLQLQALSIASLVASSPDIINAYTLDTDEEIRAAVKPAADNLRKALSDSTGLNDIRLHFHISPARSLYRSWTDKTGDDLSAFRNTVKSVISTGKPIQGIELGKGGMVIRGVHPIITSKGSVGSIEMYFQPAELLTMMNLDYEKYGLVLLADREHLLNILFEEDLKTYYSKGEIGSQMISHISSDWIDPQELLSSELIEQSRANGERIYDKKGNYSISYLPIEDFQGEIVGFYVLIQDISDQIAANDSSRLQLMILMGLLNAAILGILLFWISKFIIRPIKRLDEAVEIISRGSGDLTHRIRIKRNDELGTIADNFNLFLERLSAIIGTTRNVSISTENNSKELSEVSDKTMEATNSITQSVADSRKQLDVTHKEIASTKEYTGVIRGSLDAFQNSITQLSAIVEQSSAGITEMLASLESVNKVVQDKQILTTELVKLSKNGEGTIGETTDQINSIKNLVGQIQEFAQMIEDIASQTNLLSMNAAIEAAHAGDAGKGFAVVAEEIRSLAETSSAQSKQISDSIKLITETIMHTESSGLSSKEAFANISKAVNGVADGLYGIASSTEELTIASKEIMKAINEVKEVTYSVKDGSSEIAAQQQNLNRVVDSSLAAIDDMNVLENEMSTHSDDIRSSMALLINTVEQLSVNAADMKEEIKRFKL